ncbi:MAG: DUF4198 domain-containing protein [Gemmataceae bacterium]|nr:DUF4198 domain-containing protein [Gemmataceae bacterium]
MASVFVRGSALLIGVTLLGCSDSRPKFVPVSGRVLVDGKPVANLMVTFQPIQTDKNKDPGPGSAGITDAEGRFVLKVSSQQYSGDGAIVGKHKVRIGTVLPGEGVATDPSIGSPDDAPLAGKELIPPQYNQDTILTFEVPSSGTDQANFEIYIKTKKKP